jgi:hypothetical protein
MTLITLTPQEREGLEERAAHTQHADELRRAQAWRWLDSGERVPEVAARLRVTRQTSSNGVERFKLRTARHLLGRLTASLHRCSLRSLIATRANGALARRSGPPRGGPPTWRRGLTFGSPARA